MTTTLRDFGYTDHSMKGGTALLLSEMIRDDLLPIEILPLMLKHKTNKDPISSTTAGYLNSEARMNILQKKHVFEAAVLLRQRICQDI